MSIKLFKIENFALQMLKILFGIIIFLFFLRGVDANKILKTLFNVNPLMLITIGAVNIFSVFINSYKWNIFLPKIKFKRILRANFSSYFLSFILPGQIMQEGSKVYSLKSSNEYPLHRIAASLIVDKIISLFALVFIGLIGIYFCERDLQKEVTYFFILMAILISAMLFAFKINCITNFLQKFLNWISFKFNSFEKFTNKALEAINSWRSYANNKEVIMRNFSFSVFYQLTVVLMCYLISENVGINLSFLDWCWINGLLTFALLLPISIGGIGVREGALLGILTSFGYSREVILLLSIILLLYSAILALIGFFVFFKLKECNKSII